MGAAFLAEMVFIEDFFKTQLGLSISRSGEGTSFEQCDLVRKETKERFSLKGRIFLKREKQNERAVVTEITNYHNEIIATPDGFSAINESDVTIVACGMIVYLGMSSKVANIYIKYKSIRNQVAHQNKSSITKITTSDVIHLYNEVVVPIITQQRETRCGEEQHRP